MAHKMGALNVLEVVRETEYSYILTDGEEELFLHRRQATRALEPGEKVEVFMYFDNLKRKTATMAVPYVDTTHAGFVKVVDINRHLGAFLGVGLIKDLLLSRDDLPLMKNQWPAKGDMLFVRMKASKNQLTAKIIPRYDIPSYMKPERELIEGESYDAIAVFFAEEGVVFSTLEGHIIFVYFKHLRKQYRLGEMASVKISIVKEDFKYNGTLIEQKELMITGDALIIKEYLEAHKGSMTITDKSDPSLIQEIFKMSKSAFKRALGSLYKSKVVTLAPGLVELIPLEVVEDTVEAVEDTEEVVTEEVVTEEVVTEDVTVEETDKVTE